MLKKMVNGKEVVLSLKEEKDIKDQWEANRLAQETKDRLHGYEDKRRKEYPPIGDQLDAILKQLNYMQMDGQTNLITELDGIVGKWLAVKRLYPKPE